MTTRIAPLDPPYEPELARTLQRMMPPGVEPLKLFRTVAHNENVLDKFRSIGTYVLNFGRLDPAEREVLIHRTCARCGCEYEWGVHAAVFAPAVGLSEEQLRSTVHGSAEDGCWSERQSLLIRFADELHDTATISQDLWDEIASNWDQGQLVELMAVAGFYHLVSYMANGAAVEAESAARRFPE